MKTDRLLFGAAYYDEYLPYDRIETDMEMMEKAHINVIRIAESTWSTWEPQEGVFDFTHLHRMLRASAAHDISVIVGTPTYAVPTWLAAKCPDILSSAAVGWMSTRSARGLSFIYSLCLISFCIFIGHAPLSERALVLSYANFAPNCGFCHFGTFGSDNAISGPQVRRRSHLFALGCAGTSL